MSAWYFAFLLCARASAAVVETAPAPLPSASVGAAGASALGLSAASPISLVPSGAALAPVLSPSLAPSGSWSPAAAAAALGVAPSGGRVLLAPPAAAALTASAVPSAATPDAAPSPTNSGVDILPPPPATAVSPATPIAASAPSGLATAASPLAGHDARGVSLLVVPGAAPDARATLEEAAAAGRAFWDQSDAFGRLGDAAATVSAALTASPAAVLGAGRATSATVVSLVPALEEGALRDAVAGGAPSSLAFSSARLGAPDAAAAPAESRGVDSVPAAARAAILAAGALRRAGAPSRAPIERLTLSLGTGLVVSVRSALGMGEFSSGARRPARAAYALAPASAAPARRGAPLTSTEWLERRGLIETAADLPASSALAAPVGRADAGMSSARSVTGARDSSGAVAVFSPVGADAGSPLAWWALAFLPATLALLRDPLR